MIRRSWLVLALLLVVVTSTACAPPLKVSIRDNCAIISVQRMGEYYSVITELTLSTESGTVLWSARALPNTKPKLHFVKLCLGTNQAEPEVWGEGKDFHYSTAGEASSFSLERGVKYVIRARGPGFARTASQTFVF